MLRENNVSRAGNILKHVGRLGYIIFATKMFLNFLEVGKQGNIDRKDNVSATMFPSLPSTLINLSHAMRPGLQSAMFGQQNH